ncbi:MAG: trypsin-like peptidase domain-containing protein [Verrucomicrobiia bacterium]
MLLVVSDANGKEIATGTGFLVSSDGKLITNHHVIEKAASAVAKAENGGLFPIEGVLADDPKNDLVLLKLKGKDLPFLPLGETEKIEVGTRIAVIGSPLGLEGTLSEGIVSAVRELMGDIRLLQITAAISPGSSGSPVLDAKGEVIGIASALLRGGQALNLAVPVECATRLFLKVQPSTRLQPLQQSASSGDEAIYSDPDLRGLAAAIDGGNFSELLKLAQRLVERYPQNYLAYWALGDVHKRLGFVSDAITAYVQAIRLNRSNSNLWSALATAHWLQKDYDSAISAGQQAIKINPDDDKAWFLLGYIYSKQKKPEDSVAALRQAVRLQPGIAAYWTQLGAAYGMSRNFPESIDSRKRAVAIDPNQIQAWVGLAACYMELGQEEKAWEAARKVEKLDPKEGRKLSESLRNWVR